ncbi:MAG: hypothetical protein ACR2GD_03955 [Pyrinomonadaceae bacterium]
MKLNEKSQRAARELGDAINDAIEKSGRVARAIENLRELGYEPNLALKLEIGLLQIAPEIDEPEAEVKLELTDEDLRELRKMKISLE